MVVVYQFNANTVFLLKSELFLKRRRVVVLEGHGGYKARVPVHVVGHGHEPPVRQPHLILALRPGRVGLLGRLLVPGVDAVGLGVLLADFPVELKLR